jgi:hypothetical protein
VGLIHLDAGVVIGLLDAGDAHHRPARELLEHAMSGNDRLAMSASAFAECLVGPSRCGAAAVVTVRRLIDRLPIAVVPLDGEIAVAVATERQWPRLCVALGLNDLIDDPRFVDNGARVRHRDELRPLLAGLFVERTSSEWLAALDAAQVPCGPVNDVLAAFAQPQAVARQMRVDVEHPVLGTMPQVGVPFKLSATPASIRSAPPLLGEHSEEVLAELGYGSDDVERLRSSGVI